MFKVSDLFGGFWAKALLVLAILGMLSAGVLWVHNTGVEHCQNEQNKALLAQKADFEKKMKELQDALDAERKTHQENVAAAAKRYEDYRNMAESAYRSLHTRYREHANANPSDRFIPSDSVRDVWNAANRGCDSEASETPC